MSGGGYIDPESLRRNAIERLARSAAPPWLGLALAHGVLALRYGVARWSASNGEVSGHAVTLSLDAATLSRLDADPVARELVVVALSAGAAGRAGETVTDVSLRWDGTVLAEAQGYRSAPGSRVAASPRDALAAWLDARGAHAREVREVAVADDAVTVRALRVDGAKRDEVEHALRTLTGARAVRWETVRA